MRRFARASVALLFWAALSLAYGMAHSAGTPNKPGLHSSSASLKSKSRRVHASSRRARRAKKASWRRGQQKMDSERARQVQEALIREHYLTGEPNGVWDQRSENAMIRFQATNGWQTKVVPDSRALIKLGLGPNQDHLLNPESAMTSPREPTSNTEHGAPAGEGERAAPRPAPVAPAPGHANPLTNPRDE